MSPRQTINTMPEPLDGSALLAGLFLAESGCFTDITAPRLRLETHNEMRLYFLSGGEGAITLDGRTQTVRQNDVFFLPRGERLEFQAASATPADLWWVDFHGPALPELMRELSVSKISPVLAGLYEPRFFQELKGVIMHYDALAPADKLHLASGLYKLFALLLETCQNSQWVTVPHDSPKILYTGDWKRWPAPLNAQAAGKHEECYTAQPRAYAEYNFHGSGIKWYGTANFDCGKADVIIDGNYVATVDTYSPVRLSKQLLYVNSKLGYGHHIIKIFCTGGKNDKATNCDVVVESFQHLATARPQAEGGRRSVFSPLVHRAVDLMRSDLREINIDQLSRKLEVNRSHFSVRFSAELGLSPTQYLINLRLEAAKKMLADTDWPISRIAGEVGYADMFYFARVFKSRENLTPTQYRKLHRQSSL
ncbi:MAG: AraC family transcriptional regulator [Deltaproteobacteria bacterium]|jgi:AraC-like DNA-binding protein|nr:AraC family transcriptional regulator [Deltaproteobacteria bacterium]